MSRVTARRCQRHLSGNKLHINRRKLNYGKLSEEERKWLKRIAQKSDLLKNPKPQRGRK